MPNEGNPQNVASQVADAFNNVPTGEPDADDGVEDDADDQATVDDQVTDPDDAGDGDEVEGGDEIAELRQQNAQLLGRIDALTQMVQQGSQQQQQQQADPEPPEPVNFLEGVEFSELLEDPEKFNALLNKVHLAGREAALRDLPELIQGTVRRTTSAQSLVSRFYSENPDLKSKAPYVRVVANEIASSNPNITPEELITQVADRVRSDLDLDKPKRGGNPKRPPTPKGGNRGGNTNKRKSSDPQKRQMGEMIEAFDNRTA